MGMRYIKDMKEGDRISDVYLCKSHQSLVTKNGKAYDSVTLQDRTGTIDAKIWDPNSAGIEDFDALDYVQIYGRVTSFNNALQLNVERVRKCSEGEYDPADYLPVSPYPIEEMYGELLGYADSVKDSYLKQLLTALFREDAEFISAFKKSSAAKTVHHGFVGGLLQHTLAVVKMCDFYCTRYSSLNRDLLITAAICHDIGKTKELSLFPINDYTDDGQFLGHIVIGTEMVGEVIRSIPGFPATMAAQLKHCIISHHGEYEFGSPKKPAIIEAVALNFADNTDAKLQTFTELLESSTSDGWLGFNRLLDSNVIRTRSDS